MFYHPKKKIMYFILIAFMIVVIFPLSRIIDSFFYIKTIDEKSFIYVAKGILEGDVPYLDRWDHKMPLIYVLILAGLMISESWGTAIFQIIFLFSSLYVCFLIIKENFGIFSSLFSLSIFVFCLERFDPGNFTEFYSLLLQFVALYLFVRVERRNRRESWLPLAIGVLGGLAFLLKPNLVGIWLAVGLYWVSGARAPNRLSWSIAGGAGVIAAAAAVFAVVGGLSAFWDAAVIYNFIYIGDASLADRSGAALRLGRELSLASLVVVVGWCIGFGCRLLGRTRNERYHDLLSIGLILLPLEIALVSLSGYRSPHYYMVIIPTITMFIAYSIRLVTDFFEIIAKKHFSMKENLIAPAFTITLFIFLLVIVVYYRYDHVLQITEKYTRGDIVAQGVGPRVAERVRSATKPGDHILVWGSESSIYLLAERTAPTRFFFQYPLMKRGYAIDSLVDEFISDVKDGMPAMIIDTAGSWVPPLEKTARRDWRPPKRYERDLDTFQPLFDLVETEYEVVGKDGAWILYGRKRRRM